MPDWDVVIAGRSYASLSAALMLGRNRKSVLVIGDGPPRNGAAAHAHGLISRDHTPAVELIADAEGDLDRYDTVALQRGHVDRIDGTAGAFSVYFGDRSTTAAHVVLATGVNDEPPAIPGLADLWGRGVYTCPFCDGYEHSDQPWGLIGEIHPIHVALLRTWASSLTVLDQDPDGDIHEMLRSLAVEHVTLNTNPIRRIERGTTNGSSVKVVYDNESEEQLAAIFVTGTPKPNNQLARQLDCAVDGGGFVTVDDHQATTVSGVYAVGDLTRRGPHQMVLAAADGVMAAAAIAFSDGQALLRQG